MSFRHFRIRHRGGLVMGKLTEILRKRRQEIEQLTGQKGYDAYVKDPVAGSRKMKRFHALNYQNQQSYKKLSAAFETLSPEQRQNYFDSTLNDRAKRRFAEFGFVSMVLECQRAGDAGIRQLTQLVADRQRFGISVEDTIAGIGKIVDQKELDRIVKKFPPDISREEYAARLLASLSISDSQSVFRQMIPAEKHSAYRHLHIENQISKGDLASVLAKDEYYRAEDGKKGDWIGSLEKLEEALGEEAVEKLAAEIDQIPEPRDIEGSIVRPREGRLKELGASIREDDPEAAEKKALLERVGKILEYPSDGYLTYLNTGEKEDLPEDQNIQKSNDAYSYDTIEEFVSSLDDNGEYLEKLPHSTMTTGTVFYDGMSAQPMTSKPSGKTSGVDLTGKDREVFAKACEGKLNDKTRSQVLDVMKGFEEIGDKKFWNPESAFLMEGTWDDPIKVSYKAEQGNKKYAFWPLVDAKNEVDKAVGDGDWAKIRETTEEYERIKEVTDRMMRDVNPTEDMPHFPGNLNSTRAEGNGALNPVPAEYLEDFSGHSRLNGLFLLNAVSKNTGIPVEQLIDDPLNSCEKIADNYINEKILPSFRGKSRAAQLATGFNYSAAVNASTTWGSSVMGAFKRGFEAASCLVPTREERVKMEGRAYCGSALANQKVGEYITSWLSLGETPPDTQLNISQLAMLDPDFDLWEAGRLARKSSDWKKLDASGWIREKLSSGDLKPDELTKRTREFLEDAAVNAKDSYDLFRSAAIRNYDLILRNADPRQLSGEQLGALREHSAQLKKELQRDVLRGKDPHVGEALESLSSSLEVMRKQKEGWFLSKKDSTEFTDMRTKVVSVSNQLQLLKKGRVDGLRYDLQDQMEQRDLGKLIKDARAACFDYAAKKTDGGTSSIWHEAGVNRYNAATETFEKLGELEDRLGLRSPAQRELDRARMAVLSSRGSKSWMQNRLSLAAATSIAALSLENSGFSFEKQASLMEGKAGYERAVKRIMKDPAFLQMMSNEGNSGIADKILQGGDALTASFLKAQRQVSGPQQAGDEQVQDRLPVIREEEAPQAENPVIGSL